MKEIKCAVYTVDRIFGGEKAKLNEFPWLARLIRGEEFFCAGSLISPRYVLSGESTRTIWPFVSIIFEIAAAHCFVESLKMSVDVK
jgi:Trypsin